MTRSWAASMRGSLVTTLGHPEWWAMALAGFLIRGGILIMILPMISLPSVAQLATTLAPPIESIVMGGQTLAGALIGGFAIAGILVALGAAGMAGEWFDTALRLEAAADDDLEPAGVPVRRVSLADSLRIRLLAHIPTAAALTYGTVRVIALTYDELLSPGDPAVPVVLRVLGRAPDVIVLLVVTWLVGEAVGPLAIRRVAAGIPVRTALARSARQVASVRGLATLVATSALLLAIAVPFLLALGRASEHIRGYLLEGVDVVPLSAALVLLIGTWILGLSVLGAGLAWRSSAWTVEAARG